MRLFIILLIASTGCFAQTYPRWFLDPVDLNCGLTACGYAQNYFQKSSSDSAAFLNACESLTREHYVKIEGGEAYWATEAGVYWMGNDITEKIDSAYLRETILHGKRLAEFSSESIAIALVSDDDCAIPDSLTAEEECPREQPAWVESLPHGDGYTYAIGVAPQYFYESSSWQAAERRARFNLARSFGVKVESLQKLDRSSGQDVRNEEVSAELRDVEVVHRWRDVAKGLYYILARMSNR